MNLRVVRTGPPLIVVNEEIAKNAIREIDEGAPQTEKFTEDVLEEFLGVLENSVGEMLLAAVDAMVEEEKDKQRDKIAAADVAAIQKE